MITPTTIAASPAGHPEIVAALEAASARTGSDFDYLLATAQRESSLNSHAKSKSSSATGLFQFIDQTWLGLVKRYGAQHGLGPEAAAIRETASGHFTVASADTKAAILALRQNPMLSALMAGEAANETRESLECSLGREVCSGELYAAHFLGMGGARQLIQLYESEPDARADLNFPQAAKANRSVFYHADGTPKTVAEVYAWAVDLPGARNGAPVRIAAPAVVAGNVPVGHASNTLREAIGDRAAKSVAMPQDQASADRPVRTTPAAMPISPHAPYAAASLGGSGLPQSPLLLSPAVMEILASLAPPGLRRAI